MSKKIFPLTLLGLFSLAGAVNFAGFDIVSNGSQRIDIHTNTTILPQGGTATDGKDGLTVMGKYMEYRPGESLHTTTATLDTRDGGHMTADDALYDAKTGVLNAKGHINYSDKRVRGLTADSVVLQSKSSIVIAKGNVRSATPAMSANTVVVDYKNSRALMYGNYKYNYGGTSLSSGKADATLYVSWDSAGKPSVTTKPSSDQLAAFQPFLK